MTPLRSVGIRFSSEEPDRPCLRVQGRSNFPLMQFGSDTSLASPRTMDYVPPPPPSPDLPGRWGVRVTAPVRSPHAIRSIPIVAVDTSVTPHYHRQDRSSRRRRAV